MPPVQAGKFHLGGIFLKVIICDNYKSQSAAGADIIEKNGESVVDAVAKATGRKGR